ncbi:membrane bound O-acyl transferase family-domain-containing protein [Apiosordaria backusii]|uniref:Membrane bound O-acyl transferase family-domain-containing protein n=1 Tax=Apiosordaria backusii TaxID=314023 RepID=A0AA40EZG0_9PEZI|nr:membrane bound O-acyl transferase family-domain-containing protein [Apiosordaria backusii]
MATTPTLNPNDPHYHLPTAQVHYLRSIFYDQLSQGKTKPLVLPSAFFGTLFLPLLYLSIPHKTRPWLYRARWLVALAILYLNYQLLTTTSGSNIAISYAVGLIACHGTVWGLTAVLFTRPQWDAARVARDSKTGEYYWQFYPEDGSWGERLSWGQDLLLNFRCVGWNYAVSTIPSPPFPLLGVKGRRQRVEMEKMPKVTKAGYYISGSTREFVLDRLRHIAWSWVVIDVWTTFGRADPYIVLGPEYVYSSNHKINGLPPVLEALPMWAVSLGRSFVGITGVAAGLFFYSSIYQLINYCVLGKGGLDLLGVQGELWQYPSLFGGFWNVLEKGLGGFWGGWWHQTFRRGFAAAGEWGRLKKPGRAKTVVTVLIAFFLSGLMHASGGLTSTSPTTRFWTPIAFFVSQGVGVLGQGFVCEYFRGFISSSFSPKWRRIGNLVVVVVWLQLTGWGLIDDMSRAGIWLFEPVPFSPVRWLVKVFGYGDMLGGNNKNLWRLDEEYGLRWWWGPEGRWWESGLRL